jgi:abortive infection bacteriophage resistance protein
VKHHIENYDGQFPLWVICELFTFGMISYFYNDLTTEDKKKFVGAEYKEMVSWLRCCTDLRNICAHYVRLYYRIFSAMPSGFSIF